MEALLESKELLSSVTSGKSLTLNTHGHKGSFRPNPSQSVQILVFLKPVTRWAVVFRR